MRRTHALYAVPVAASALLLSACSSSTTSGTSTSGSGGAASTGSGGGSKDVLTLGATADMYGWDPSNQPGYQNWAGEAVWDNLARCNSVGALTPDVAQSWTVGNNN